jgi:predicted aspartyl protease
MFKTIILIVVGIISGWLITTNWQQSQQTEQVELSLVLKVCPEFFDQTDLAETQLEATPHSLKLTQNNFANCESSSTQTNTNEVIDEIIEKLLKNRSILHADLSALSHWDSFDDFESYLNRFKLSASALHRLLAKAYIYFNQNYINALENLYSSRQAASDIDSIKNIQGEINALISFMRRTYFSLNSTISEDTFLRFMDFAYEKQPDYLPVILALTKHYLFVKDFDLSKNYIEAIPGIPENQQAIDLMTERLQLSKDQADETAGGIPMIKSGNHFVVRVSINQEIQLNLMLDTGATRTVVSPRTMQGMMQVSDDIIDLEVFQHVRTATGRSISHLFQANELDVGGYKLEKPLILTSNLVDDANIHGLLGMDFLGQFEFRIDHQKNLLFLSY